MVEKNPEGPQRATFTTLCGGCLPERLEHSLQNLYNNIADENTDPEAKRKVVVTFSVKPNRDRDAAALDVKIEEKLAPMMSAGGRVFLRIAPDGTQIAIPDTPPEQGDLFPAAGPKLAPVAKKDGTNG